ncbi:MAG: O-antigen ligase family protein [Erythrobacter sp.]
MIHPASEQRVFAERTGWLLLGGLAFLVAMLGGSSRPDAVQLVALRPLSALFLIPALYGLHRSYLAGARTLLLLFGAIAVWTLIQLIPLPPAIWQALPGREAIAQMDALLGLDGHWRPISLGPWRGWNALAALVLPIAALLLAVATQARAKTLLLIVVGLGVADAVLGLLQVGFGAGGALYFYTHTNEGTPVGIFANENHSGVFSACVLMVLARLALEERSAERQPAIKIAYPAVFLIVLLVALVSGSRAGLLTTAIAIAASAGMAWAVLSKRSQADRHKKSSKFRIAPQKLLFGVVGLLVLIIVGAFFAFDRAPALNAILAQDALADLRWAIWPTLVEMISTHWAFGTGFGSFEEVYHIFERPSLLFSKYLNQAHNDWAQYLIEGGVPAVAILIALALWVARALRKSISVSEAPLLTKIFWLGLASIVAIASAFDYPLRTPIFQLVATWLLVVLALESRENVATS